jgi:hypothetical protein
MRFYLKKALGIAVVLSFLMLTACFEPSAVETKEGSFTISLGANENTRAIFPPANSSDLRFSLKFRNTASKAETTFTSNGGGSIKGKIGVGNYIVTMDVSLISDGSPYARGVAYDNPIEIGPGQNQIKVYVFDVNNAAPPVISAKPQGASSTTGAAVLTVTASVSDSGRLSYQWYSNTTNTTSGGSAISGATSPSYTPPTVMLGNSSVALGTPWHYVVVTNTSTGNPTTINTVPVSIVNSGTSGAPGSADNPFLVNDVTTLRKVGSGTDGWTLDAHYRQTADIVLPQVSQGGSNWTPIGTDYYSVPFTGNYDGNGKTISNLTINAPTEDYQGLFGCIDSGAVVKNVGLVNCSVVGRSDVGGVVGMNNGTVQNCYSTGSVSGMDAGGVVGSNWENSSTVQNCYSTGSVSGRYAGGVVGNNAGTVQNCYATGNVSSDVYGGGVVGQNYGSGTVQNCYATGTVSGMDTGGVVGENFGTVQNCVALNQNILNSSRIGRVVGEVRTSNGTPTLANNYGRSDMKVEGRSTSWANIGLNNRDGADVSDSQYSTQTWWTTGPRFDFTNVWEWGSNNLPKLKGVVNNPGTGGGNGTEADPFLVYDVATLQKVGSKTNGWSEIAQYKQTADIDLSSVSNWTPIGNFNGSYDGNGKTISNLTINVPSEDSQGVFSRLGSSAVVKNVGLVNCSVVGRDINSEVGGVVGRNGGTVQNCYVTGSVSGDRSIGGVVGFNYGTVQDCYVKGSVSGSNNIVGGVVGLNIGTVQNCYVTATVSGDQYIGGVAGYNQQSGDNYNATIQNCYATGNVSGSFYVGGVVGENTCRVQYCYATGNVSGNGAIGGVAGQSYSSDNSYGTIQNCYATGNVSGGDVVGGVVGSNGGTVQYCYATGNVSRTDSSGYGFVGYVGGVVASNSSKVQNCVALNFDVSVDAYGVFGRVVGNLSGTHTLANNYGRSDMKINGGSTTWINIGPNDLDGASITSSNWGAQSWWTNAGNWDTAGWNFTNVWEWRSNSLPILRNMPGTATQNPVVVP